MKKNPGVDCGQTLLLKQAATTGFFCPFILFLPCHALLALAGHLKVVHRTLESALDVIAGQETYPRDLGVLGSCSLQYPFASLSAIFTQSRLRSLIFISVTNHKLFICLRQRSLPQRSSLSPKPMIPVSLTPRNYAIRHLTPSSSRLVFYYHC